MKFFETPQTPTMNELVYWFMVSYTDLVDSMQEATHAVTTNEPNPYHSGDNSIWTHTMLVCQRAEIASEEKYSKVNLICALLHDTGKPLALETIPFEKTKPVLTEANAQRNEDMKKKKKNQIIYPAEAIDILTDEQLLRRFSKEYEEFKAQS